MVPAHPVVTDTASGEGLRAFGMAIYGAQIGERLFEKAGFLVKSRITLRDTWSRRQAGAMRPVRRAGWVWAASLSPAAKFPWPQSIPQVRVFLVAPGKKFVPPPQWGGLDLYSIQAAAIEARSF